MLSSVAASSHYLPHTLACTRQQTVIVVPGGITTEVCASKPLLLRSQSLPNRCRILLPPLLSSLCPQFPSRTAQDWCTVVLSSLLSVLSNHYLPHTSWTSNGGLLLPNGLQLFIDRKGVGWNAPT